MEVIGESGHCEGCGRSGWYLVIKGGDVHGESRGDWEEKSEIEVVLGSRSRWGRVYREHCQGDIYGTGLLRIVIIFH